MSRRDRIDPETARLVQERLQWLLTENGPEQSTVTRQATVTQQPVQQRRMQPFGADSAHAAPRRSRPVAPADRSGRAVDQEEDDAAEEAAQEVLPRVRPRQPRPSLSGAGQPLLTAVGTAVGSFRRPHLVIVGAIVALGILLAGWAVLRARPVAVAVTPPPVTATRAGSADPGSDAGSSANPSPTAPPLVVHVLGAVKKPGLVRLAAGGRVQDALDAAGGLTAKADPGELNLAQEVSDGQQIVVGTKGKPSGEVRDGSAGGAGSSPGSGAAGGSADSTAQPVNLNTANQAQLEELPGVGPVMAGKIIAWRTEHGRFNRIEELQEIDGVGPKTYAKLAPLCRI